MVGWTDDLSTPTGRLDPFRGRSGFENNRNQLLCWVRSAGGVRVTSRVAGFSLPTLTRFSVLKVCLEGGGNSDAQEARQRVIIVIRY